ncbi:Fibronectin type III protein [Algoriella xinjiangensis]|uniref:phage tail protein n=1 Tax=Algoriella xinjiangensis TaxID=684065 RepID=UPI000F6439D0|nr:phage tail protein [Algoriella xinjiangensis]VDH16098.1 Fibronectin type III protein [Algoriella xinjiangensis]
MEQILVKRSDNVDYLLEDRNKGVFVSSIIQSTELRSNDVINVEIISREFINFTIGDSFHYLGQKYTLNQIPRYFKNSSNDFQYSITFEGVMFDLRRASYDVNIDTTGSAIYGETLTADLELFAKILIENINRVFPDKWVLGELPAETETKTITFSEEENCLAALQMLCDEYDTDFIIKTNNNGVNILNFKQVGIEIPLEFKVGFQKGLYTLTREKVDASDIVTRLKVYGSDKNLGTDYRANRLVLKDKNKPNSYIENTQAVAKYGIYESTKIFDEIYPRRKGKVTSINSESPYKFSDLSMDFDLNEKENGNTKYLINGTAAKIHFNKGDLSGYEFDVHTYDNTLKEFHIIKFADENGYEFPSKDNDAFRIAVGDEYVILDIQMPQSYIDNAEAELFEKANEYLSDKLEPNIQYLLDVDTLHLQRILNNTVTHFFSIGDFIKVFDEDFDINRYIRIKSIERDLRNPFDYKLTLSDSKITNFLSGTIPGEINTIKNIIKINNLNNPAKARRNWKDAQEVLNMVFDVEGDYYTEKIKPNSIETTHLQVGAKSMQFNLIDSFFEPNFEGNPNKIRWSTCKLVHFTISDKIIDWQIQGGQKDLESNKPYYLYAKCNKTNNIGVIEITESQYTVDQVGSYYFLIGIINTYSDDVKAREISLMYGFTTVSGRFIKTGRIQSADGNTYFDLDSGEISGKITFLDGSEAYEQIYGGIVIGGENLLSGSSTQQLGYDLEEDKKLRYAGQIKEFCLSVDVTLPTNMDVCFYVIGRKNDNTAETLGYKVFEGIKANKRSRVYATFECDISTYKKFFLVLKNEANDQDVQVEFLQPKLELGKFPTDYSESGNDIKVYNENRIKEIEEKASFLSTTISGNIIATGMLMVGDKKGANAGISGFTENGKQSVRFWAGAKASDRVNAIFRVLDDGSVYMSNAYVKGEVHATSGTFTGRIEANSGYIGGLTLQDKLLTTTDINSGIWFTYENDDYKSSIRMGNNIGEGILPEQNYYPFLMIQNQAKKVVTPWESFKAGIHLDMKSFNDDILSYPAIEVKNGHYQGLAFNTETFTSGQTINRDTDFGYVASSDGSSPIIKLPLNPRQGKFLILINPTENNYTTVEGNGKKIGYKFSSGMAAIQFTKTAILIFSGNMWYIITTS